MLTPTQFEELTAELLRALDYHDIQRVGGSGDLGADIIGRDRQGRTVVVQCKRFAPGSAVGTPIVQTFIGMLTVHHRADRGIIVTTAPFSQPAIELARQHGIALIDGPTLLLLLQLTGVGLASAPTWHPTPAPPPVRPTPLSAPPPAPPWTSAHPASPPFPGATPPTGNSQPAPGHRFCDQCGAALGAGARFCPSCGVPLVHNGGTPQPTLQSRSPAPARIVCPICQTSMPAGATRCSGCLRPLPGSAADPSKP